MTELLKIKDLSVSFHTPDGVIEAVKHADLTIEKGEMLALVGESGSGKTVTGLSIPQMLPNTAFHPSGSVIYEGKELIGAPQELLRSLRGNKISMIFQEPMTSLNPLHTIEKQIGEILKVHRGFSPQESRERCLEVLHMVGLSEAESRLKAYPHQLSGGQRQRVMIAIALANEPDLLIADEPTTALDVTIQAQILKLLKDLQKRLQMAVLLISHDLNVVGKISDRVAVMTKGEIVETDDVQRIMNEPRHSYTKHLIAAEPKGAPVDPAPDAPVVMEVDNIKVYFPITKGILRRTVAHVKAVDEVSFSVRKGQTIGVVGESGSGKTTLGLALLRLTKSTGRIVFMGNEIQDLKAKTIRPMRHHMQVVFQDPYGSLSPRMTVGEIISEGLKVHEPERTNSELRKTISEALVEVGLEEYMQDRLPHEFSGGQRQRIALARAIALKPQFIILDEPTSALDRSVQAQMIDLLRELQARHNIAYMFISHDLMVVRALSHYVIVMRHGKIVEQGDTHMVFDNPEKGYTKALMAAALNLEVVENNAYTPE